MYQGNQRPYNRNRDRNEANKSLEQATHIQLTNDNYVDLAEKAIDVAINEATNGKMVSSSQLRNLLSMSADIYNEVVNQRENSLSDEIKGRINYLKIRFIYESGRKEEVKTLFECADIQKHIDDIKDSRSQYILFSRYMESLVAFRRYKYKWDE